MGTEQRTILTINAGSSSIKLSLFADEPLQATYELDITNIGQAGTRLTTRKLPEPPESKPVGANNHAEAIAAALDHLASQRAAENLAAIGHRIVHGGQAFDGPTVVTTDAIQQLKDLAVFDPAHMPVAIRLIETLAARFPRITQVVCFDTTFYRDLPKVARLLPLPRKLETLGLRRYGFHGLSYESLLNNFRASAGDTAAHGRIILAHLGSGASLTAMKDGRVVDTTMSFTPASGIPMSSRSGDLDPGIIDFLHRQTGMTTEAFNHMIHFESGLLGVSELSPDMELLLQQAGSNTHAADAVELFCHQTKKAIGGLAAVLNGIDSLIFAGGMGEHAPAIRAAICSGLGYLGISLDDQRNAAGNFLISADGSRVGVHVMHTDEAAVIAAQTKQTIDGGTT